MRPSGSRRLRRHGEPPPGDGARDDLPAHDRRGRRAIPVVLPPCVSDLESLIARLDGVCLSGGPDLDPEAYGAASATPSSGRPSRRWTPSSSRSRARRSSAGCRSGHLPRRAGAQRRLRRHAAPAPARPPPERAGDARHARGRGAERHAARGLIGARHRRRQLLPPPGRRPVGAGLRVAARAADGTVEAIEGRGFAIGVQWHAETLADARLFEALVGACAPRCAPLRRPNSAVRTPHARSWGRGATPPSACAAWSSASARSPPSTTSTSTCPRAPASACSAPTAPASRRR